MGVEDVVLLKEHVTDAFQEYVDECWRTAELLKEKGNCWAQYNGVMKNLREMLVEQSTLLQSLGDLPKKAQELTVKNERIEVKGNESDIDLLNKAASILNKGDGGKKRPQDLH